MAKQYIRICQMITLQREVERLTIFNITVLDQFSNENRNEMKRKFSFIIICCGCLTILAEQNTTGTGQWHRKYDDNSTHFGSPRMATPCETPNKDPGYCIEIQKCTHLYLQLSNTDALEFLRASHCGPSNEDRQHPKVCCGRYNNYKDRLNENEFNNPLPKNCGVQDYSMETRIFGGVEAELGEFPWMARLIHKNRYGYRTFGCSAFLIHSKYVLTAAHCLESDNIRIIGPVFEVQLGEHNTDTLIDCNHDNTTCAPKPQKARVLDLIVHPKYDKTSKNFHYDIALVHLKKGMSFNTYIYPICLLENPVAGPFEYWISGWGKTETEQSSPVKLKVSLPPYSWEECSLKYRNVQITLKHSQICAGGAKNRDSCAGDSGGPLMVVQNGKHWFAAGIVSYGIGCGRENWPGVYTNITSYVEWIKQEMIKHSKKRTDTKTT